MGFLGSLSKSTGGIISGTTLGGGAGFLLGGPAGAAIGAGLGSGLDQMNAQEEANKQNLKLDSINRQWQERMSNSAYQRSMADMKKAGLNPMLAYQQGGASVPSTSAAQVQAVSAGDVGNKVLNGYTSMSAAQVQQQAQKTAQDTATANIAQTTAQTAKTVQETQNAQLDAKLKKQELEGKGIIDSFDRKGGVLVKKLLSTVEDVGLRTSAKESAKEQKRWSSAEKQVKPIDPKNSSSLNGVFHHFKNSFQKKD